MVAEAAASRPGQPPLPALAVGGPDPAAACLWANGLYAALPPVAAASFQAWMTSLPLDAAGDFVASAPTYADASMGSETSSSVDGHVPPTPPGVRRCTSGWPPPRPPP